MISAFKPYLNNYNLAGIAGVYFTRRKTHKLGSRSIKSYKLGMTDGNRQVRSEYGIKQVELEGFIQASTLAAAEQVRDELVGRLQGDRVFLDIMQAGALRRYLVTFNNVIFTDAEGGYMPFSIEFESEMPYGYDPNLTTDVNSVAISGATQTHNPNFGGKYKIEPIITVTIATLTGGASASISVGNSQTGREITVTRGWSAADVLVIDNENKTVQVNGEDVEFSGAWLEFDPYDSNEDIAYEDTFSARTGTFKVQSHRRYL